MIRYPIGVAHDITERERTEKALRESEERLQLALVHWERSKQLFFPVL